MIKWLDISDISHLSIISFYCANVCVAQIPLSNNNESVLTECLHNPHKTSFTVYSVSIVSLHLVIYACSVKRCYMQALRTGMLSMAVSTHKANCYCQRTNNLFVDQIKELSLQKQLDRVQWDRMQGPWSVFYNIKLLLTLHSFYLKVLSLHKKI